MPETADADKETEEQTSETEPAVTTISILGDSISTFQGYIPAGYYDFFPGNGLVSDVNDTWWRRVLDDTGWMLYVNGSSSGATCVGDSTGTADPQCGCNEFRTGALYGPGNTAPDVIIVYMGTNDLLQSIPMGDNDGTRQVAEGQVAAFSDAYTLMIDKLLAKYPSSRIYCCTITQIGDYGTSTPYVEFVNGENLTAADYSARIRQIAANKNLPVQKQRKQLGSLLFYIGNTIIALIFVSPLIWMIASSLKPEAGIFKGLNSLSTFIPKDASLNNYVEVFNRINMWKFIFNSLFYVLVIIVLDLFVNSLCGYALAKFEFKGKNALLTLVISLMVFPAEAIMLPMYRDAESSQPAAFFRVRSACASVRAAACSGVSSLYFMVSISFWNGA